MSRGEGHLYTAFPQKPVEFVRAHGAHLWASDGSRYVDLGGASHGVANLGHNHPRVVAAVCEQAGHLTHVVQTVASPVRAAFLDRLHAVLPPHVERSFLANSGAEAVEAALKFAHARTGRRRIVAVRNAFHGRTLGALSATWRPQYRQPFDPLLQPTDFVPLNDVPALEAAVRDDTAAVLVEPIQGEGGVHVATDAYLRAVEGVAHAHGALLVVDEVQTGIGRTGRDLAIDGVGVRPDMVLLGKSLAGGLPVGVCAMTEDVARAMPKAGHGNTFGGSPLVCAAAAATLDVLREERLSDRSRTEGERFLSRFRSMRSPLVRDVRGRGLMVGVDVRIHAQPVLARLLDRHLLALPAGPTVVRFLPPLVTDRGDLDAAAEALDQALADPALAAARPEEAVA